MIGPGYKITKSPLPFPAGYALYTPLSSVVGAKVYGGSSNFSVDISQDETSWSDYDWTAAMTISYRDLDINPNIIANCKVSQGATQWTWTGGPLSGQTTDTVPANPRSRVEINFIDTDVSAAISANPAYFRLNCVVHKPPYHATLSADEELTNGYVTFPITTPDTGSLVQDTVVVDKPHSFNGTVKKTGQFPATISQDEILPSVLQVSAKELDAVGAVVNANDIGPKQIKQWRNANPVPDDLSAWTTSTWLIDLGDNDYLPAAVIIEGYIDEHGNVQGTEVYCKQKADDPTKFVFADRVGAFPAQYVNERETYTLTENSRFARKLNFHANWYYGQAIDLVLDGTPTKATFKLNVNTFKSNQGDKEYIKELPDVPTKTTEFAGTYSDNTPFSFDIFYK